MRVDLGEGDDNNNDIKLVALDDGGFLVLWDDDSNNEDPLAGRGQRYSALGFAAGSEFVIDATSADNIEGVLLDDGRVQLVWSDGVIRSRIIDTRDAPNTTIGPSGLQTGTTNGDVFTAAADATLVNAWTGDDFVTSAGTEKSYMLGVGNDWMKVTSDIEADGFDGGVDTDTIDWSEVNEVGATFDMTTGTATDTDLNAEVMIGFENLIGTENADSIIGTDDANVLTGLGGDDTIEGRDGADLIHGDGVPFYLRTMNAGTERGQFTSVESFVDMPTTAFTAEMLFRGTEIGSSGIGFMSYAVSGSTNEFLVFGNTDGTIEILLNGTGIDTGVPTSDLLDGEMHRISVSVDITAGANTGVEFYVDGIREFSGFFTTAALTTPIEAGGIVNVGQDQDALGGSFQTTQALQGEVGDIHIWSSARSGTDIANSAVTPLTAYDPAINPDLVGIWQLGVEKSFTNIAGTAGMTNSTDPATFDIAACSDEGGGADSIDGGEGDNTIFGGDGNHPITSGSGDADLNLIRGAMVPTQTWPSVAPTRFRAARVTMCSGSQTGPLQTRPWMAVPGSTPWTSPQRLGATRSSSWVSTSIWATRAAARLSRATARTSPSPARA